MFKGDPAIEPFSVDAPKEKPIALAETKVGPLLDIETKPPAGTVTGATEEIVVGPRSPAPKPAEDGAPGDMLSGDDVAQRLDTILTKGKRPGRPAAHNHRRRPTSSPSTATRRLRPTGPRGG